MTALLQEIAELAAWINRIQEEGGIVTNDEAWEVVGHAASSAIS